MHLVFNLFYFTGIDKLNKQLVCHVNSGHQLLNQYDKQLSVSSIVEL